MGKQLSLLKSPRRPRRKTRFSRRKRLDTLPCQYVRKTRGKERVICGHRARPFKVNGLLQMTLCLCHVNRLAKRVHIAEAA